jgi:hypothetical protein
MWQIIETHLSRRSCRSFAKLAVDERLTPSSLEAGAATKDDAMVISLLV